MVQTATNVVENLDRIDRQLLHELQRDGRMPVAELARRVNRSPTPCIERLKRLEQEGFIRGYAAQLDAKRLGFGVTAFIEVSVDRTTPDLLQRFHADIGNLPDVVECHMVAGAFDYLLKIRAANLEGFRRFLGDELFVVPGLNHTHTHIVLETVSAHPEISLLNE